MTKRKASFINFIIALIPVIILAVLISVFFDYYYELNDDVLMKDILSGMYDGTPSGYNIQMQWPLSAFVAQLYRAYPAGCWYGVMLLLFQYGSLIIIDYRLIKRIEKIWIKILTSVSFITLISSYMLFHLCCVQYTVTVAMMAGAAIAVMSACDDENHGSIIYGNVPTILILFFGFMLRSEMMLLMMPFVCAAAVFKWSLGKRKYSKDTLKGYIRVFAIIAISFLIALGANKVAYRTEEWSNFVDLFDARTELYDYQVPPSYEGNERFYNAIDFSKEEAVLFENYNYGMDKKVDNKLMWAVANYAGDVNKSSRSTVTKLSEKLKIYVYEFTHVWSAPGTDYPWNIAVILLYVFCLIMLVFNRDFIGIWRILALFAGRSAIWIYMLMGERTPARITDSLYFVETITLIFLLGMLMSFNQNKADDKERADKKVNITTVVASALALLLGVVFLMQAIPQVEYDEELKAQTNAPYMEFFEYINAHPHNVYLMDTYSSVAYSEKMFDTKVALIDKSNMNTLGGWAALSPIEKNKLSSRGVGSMFTGMLKGEVYFCKKSDIDMDWLEALYRVNDINVDINLEDTVSSFEIYRVTEKKGEQ